MIKKLFIELNEITYEFCKEYDDNFYFLEELFKTKSIFGFNLLTRSDGTREGIDLDPWVEWVTIHCGKPFSVHKIKSLGAGKNCKYKMAWDIWEEKSNSYSIWNVFNAYLKKRNNCKTYLPDPWASSIPKPNLLRILLTPTTVLARKYTGLNIFFKIFYGAISSLFFLPIIVFKIKILTKMFLKYGLKHLSFSDFYIVYEYLLANAGLCLNKFLKTDNVVIGTNLVAHAQHHFWNDKKKANSCYRSLYLANDLLRTSYKNFRSKYQIFILNSISQKCIAKLDEYDYLPKFGHQRLFEEIGIDYKNVFPNMSNDGYLKFKSKSQMIRAYKILSNLNVFGENLFTLNSRDNLTLEYYLSFRARVDLGALVTGLNKKLFFYDLFKNNGKRTGSHHPNGFIVVPSELVSEEILQPIPNQKLVKYFTN